MRFYIDPGTGSMLFTILLSVIGAAIYSLRLFFMKLRSGAFLKNNKENKNVIPFAIYSDDKRYWNIFEPICREMDRLGKDVVYLTGSEDDPVFSCGYAHIQPRYIGKGNAGFAQLNYLEATVLLSTTPSLDVYQWKRSKGVKHYAHIMHSAGEITMYRMFGIDYYDSVLISGDYQERDIRDLETLRNLPAKDVVKVGQPFMDEMKKRLAEDEPLPAHQRTVLLAPSWGNSAIFAVYGGEIIDLLLETGYHIIIRPHPQSFASEKELLEGLMEKYPDSDRLEWNRDRDNYQVLRESDILISDFSGVIYEFALIYDKPVIYTAANPDLSLYDAWWLNRPLWKATALPRIGCELTKDNIGQIKEIIDTCIEDPQYAQGRREVKAETWCHEGEGTQRTVEFLLQKYEELTKEGTEK